MKVLEQLQPDNLSNLLLYGAIMFANIDYVGIMDYLLKAVLGGIVWFAFKFLQDYYSPRVRKIGKEHMRKSELEKSKRK